MRYKILMVGNDLEALQSIKEAFTKEKEVAVITSDSADVGIEMAWKEKPDILIINRTLPDLSGWEMLGILKKNKPTRSIPSIILNDKRGKVEDEIKALDLGADDYMVKPFDPEVFRARITAVLRRSLSSKKESKAEEILKSGNISLNITAHLAYVKKQLVDLTPKEFALLYLFIKKRNRVLNKVFLSEVIWEREYFATSRTIDKHIANLRKKLGSEGKRIKTLSTIGYKFIDDFID